MFADVCRILDHFTLTLIEYILTPHGCLKVVCSWKEERTKEYQVKVNHGWFVVDATVHGVFISREAFYFLGTFRLPDRFNSIITSGCSASMNFTIKRGASQAHVTHPSSHSMLFFLFK